MGLVQPVKERQLNNYEYKVISAPEKEADTTRPRTSSKASFRKFMAANALQAVDRQQLLEVLNKYGGFLGAVSAGDCNAIRIMAEHGVVNVDVRQNHLPEANLRPGEKRVWMGQGKSALEVAVEKHDLSLAKLLLSKGASPLAGRNSYRPLQHMNGMAIGPPAYETKTAAYDAIQTRQTEMIKVFLDAEMDPNSICFGTAITLLGAAREAKATEIVMLLLDRGARI